MQLRQRMSVTGKRVVSAANLAECWKGGALVPFSPNTVPDGLSQRYGMGWQRPEFKDGTILMWHNGAIEGFTSYMDFPPQHDVGIVVLNNMNVAPTGIDVYVYVVTLLLNPTIRSRPGGHGEGARLQRLRSGRTAAAWPAGHESRLQGRRALPRVLRGRVHTRPRGRRPRPAHRLPGHALVAMPDETYLVAAGLILGTTVKLATEADGTPHLEIVGIQTVRRTTGLA